MSSPKRAAKAYASESCREIRRRKPRRGAACARGEAGRRGRFDGASAEAKRLAAELERSIVDGKLDLVSAEALQKLIAAACRVYTARARGRRAVHAGAEKFDFRHRRDGHGERVVAGRRSRRFRARHVAELDGPLSSPF